MPSQLFLQFAVSTVMVVVCVVIHGIGLFSLNTALRGEATIERLRHIRPLSPRGGLFTLSRAVDHRPAWRGDLEFRAGL